MRFTFQFNPYLYRVCNLRTWERLEQMDGLEVAVVGGPFRLEAWSEEDGSDVIVPGNNVRATFPDGHVMTLLIFNSELQAVTEDESTSPDSELQFELAPICEPTVPATDESPER